MKLRRIRGLCDAVRKLPADQVDAYLDRERAADPALAAGVRRLLLLDAGSDPVLDGPAHEALGLDEDDSPEPVTVSQVGTGGDARAWDEFLEQIKSRGPTWQRYEDSGEVARGGMGSIHKVRGQDPCRTLAMKIILRKDADAARIDNSLGRFLEEAQVTSQLDHPAIVPIHDIGVDKNSQVFFTMKLVKGEDLRSAFDRVHDPSDDGWNPTRALSLMLKICEAMAYAHSKGVLHRDLKPSNVMVGKYGELYVMDWGLARVMGQADRKDIRPRPEPGMTSTEVKSERKDSSGALAESPLATMDGDVVGTPSYMPPEQAAGQLEKIGQHSDVYAVGAMLYHLPTGQMPYVEPGDRISGHMVLAMVRHAAPRAIHKVRSDVPAKLQAICEKAMERTIAKRYADMEELAVDLRAYLEHRVVAAYESGPVAELKQWVKRNKGITATAAAAVVAISVLTGWFVVTVKAGERTALTERERADENARTARVNAEEARRNADEMGRLSDVKTLSDLKAEMSDLWPAHPEKAQPMRDWLAHARTLLEQQPLHEQTLMNLRAQGTPTEHPQESELAKQEGTASNLAQDLEATSKEEGRPEKQDALHRLRETITSLEAQLRREQPHKFEDDKLSWWHETLIGLVSGLEAFSGQDPFGDTVMSVRERLEFADTIEKNSITYYQEEWDAAIGSIADPEECPQYGGLEITTQLGLVPIGRDLESGLRIWRTSTARRTGGRRAGGTKTTSTTASPFTLRWVGTRRMRSGCTM